ncbi:MAG: hypothetical protein ACM3OC_04190 [Deltaproteobacteria bacterium]
MRFNEVKEEIKRVGFKDMDIDSDNLFEGILKKEKITTVTRTLENFFGQPAWPSKNKLSMQMEKLIAQYGGIMQGQTLYLDSKDRKEVVFCMLWPWKDGEHTTVKLIQNSLEPEVNTGLNEVSY